MESLAESPMTENLPMPHEATPTLLPILDTLSRGKSLSYDLTFTLISDHVELPSGPADCTSIISALTLPWVSNPHGKRNLLGPRGHSGGLHWLQTLIVTLILSHIAK